MWVLDVCERIDAALYGWRMRLVIFLTVIAAIAGPVLDHVFAGDLIIPVPLCSFLSLVPLGFALLLFGVAQVGSFRDEDGVWSKALVGRRLGQGVSAIVDSAVLWISVPLDQKLRSAGRTGTVLSLLLLCISNLERFGRGLFLWVTNRQAGDYKPWTDAGEYLCIGAWLALFCALALWALGWWRGRSSPLAEAIRVTRAHRQHGVLGVSWPTVIDCRNDDVKAIAGRISDPVVAELLRALADWKPRGCRLEDEYQAALAHHLRRKMPGTAEREVRVGEHSEGTSGKVDFVVADHVLIEMKRELNKQTADKALGQVQRYCMACPGKPVLLVLCNSTIRDSNRFIVKAFHAMQQQAQVAIVVTNG